MIDMKPTPKLGGCFLAGMNSDVEPNKSFKDMWMDSPNYKIIHYPNWDDLPGKNSYPFHVKL